MQGKIAVVLGTRPEIIKMSPVIRALEARHLDHFVLHTGQHYSYNMDRVFFESLRLKPPKHNLGVGSGSHAEETAKMLVGIEKALLEESPGVVLVEGDTNTVLAASLAASKLGICVGHVEAGLRSLDRSMPEEINRIVADHLSGLLFAPTAGARENLLREGIGGSKIHVTGNTIVDAVAQNLPIARESPNPIPLSGEYFLATIHRQENVDSRNRLEGILKALALVAQEFGVRIIYPMHPRTRKRLAEYGIGVPDRVEAVEPLGYLQFLKLESGASLILTDSGGVQEEACILGVPCVTLRDNTERPETVEAGANTLAGTDPASVLRATKEMLGRRRKWENPFGDGKAAERIVGILERG